MTLSQAWTMIARNAERDYHQGTPLGLCRLIQDALDADIITEDQYNDMNQALAQHAAQLGFKVGDYYFWPKTKKGNRQRVLFAERQALRTLYLELGAE